MCCVIFFMSPVQILVQSNSLSEQIRVLEGEVEEVSLPEMVDVIVSEPMGYMLLSDRLMERFLQARKWLKPNGRSKSFSDAEVEESSLILLVCFQVNDWFNWWKSLSLFSNLGALSGWGSDVNLCFEVLIWLWRKGTFRTDQQTNNDLFKDLKQKVKDLQYLYIYVYYFCILVFFRTFPSWLGTGLFWFGTCRTDLYVSTGDLSWLWICLGTYRYYLDMGHVSIDLGFVLRVTHSHKSRHVSWIVCIDLGHTFLDLIQDGLEDWPILTCDKFVLTCVSWLWICFQIKNLDIGLVSIDLAWFDLFELI